MGALSLIHTMGSGRSRPAWLFFLLLALALRPQPGPAAVTVSTVAGLRQAVDQANAGGDPDILLQNGVYHLNGVYLRITRNGVTVRSASGNREDVTLDGDYQTTEIFQVVASNVTIADLTLERAYDHPIHVMATDGHNVTGTRIDNVHIIDPGQQAIKINPDSSRSHTVDHGTVRNSLIELTDSGRAFVWDRNGSCYTGGIDAHLATGWTIEDNVIRGFWCSGGLAEHGIHFWSDSRDTLVQRNRIIDCDRGIGFGLGDSGHHGGIIRNNMIYHPQDHGHSDVGIGLESAPGARVYNNTIFFDHDYPNGIEYRFPATSSVLISNNLTNRAIVPRDSATAVVSHNVRTAMANWFIAPDRGDLHLAGAVAGVTDSGLEISGLADDFDGQPRPGGSGIDIGADELVPGLPPNPPDNGRAACPPMLLLLLGTRP
ncbi:MAG TPA: hypothetical protein ENI89_02485 [Desulfobulbus sp.]|nr:hypothetical protein [Desulfobulbus sp.]